MRFRLLKMIIAALLRKCDLNIIDQSVLKFRVMPWDCDIKIVSNDRYHAFMDLGRMDLVIRCGWWQHLWKNKWISFVKTANIRYRYPLRLFQSFTLRTRFLYRDEQYFWMLHEFERNGRTVAIAISKNSAWGKNGVVKTNEALQALNKNFTNPGNPSEIVQIINDSETLLQKMQKT
ncbi:hypothetical protein A3860_38945 [Niastella vici]|uniref:Thioesterase n=1 Tax=Niastella vici TaxID=1703345 RepID=A0A1V9FLF3_9BACT|nr:acyl-CoA thioesterase [Niastella vici]OQP59086.1 hypothetical protein A3860_38945 [Niastella vici]